MKFQGSFHICVNCGNVSMPDSTDIRVPSENLVDAELSTLGTPFPHLRMTDDCQTQEQYGMEGF